MQVFLRLSIIVACTVWLSTPVSVGQINSDEALLSRRIRGVEVRRTNIHLVLSYISESYEVPIGLEVAGEGANNREIYVNLQNTTLREVLNTIVAEDSRYEWRVHHGVINFSPRTDRDNFLKEVLDTKVREFSIKKRINSFDLRRDIADLPEVKRKFEEAGVTPAISAFTNADSRDLGEFRLRTSDTTLRDILNKIIETSELKYWIVNRDGPRGEYVILNF